VSRNLFRLGIWTLATLAAGICLGVAVTKAPQREPAKPVDQPAASVQPGQTGPMGWVDDPVAVAAVVAAMPVKSFAETPAFRETADAPDHAYLWEAAAKVLGHPFPPLNQGQVGSCVANGAAGAVDILQLQQIAAAIKAGRPPPEYRPVSPEVIYAGARVEIGGGRIRGDGAVGAWAIQYCQRKGVVAQMKYPSVDLSAYSEARCRSWGNTGVPAEIDAVAAQHPVKDGAPVRTAEEAEKALANGYTVTVASSQGVREPVAAGRPGISAAERDVGTPDVHTRLPQGRPPRLPDPEFVGGRLGGRAEGRRRPAGRELLGRPGRGGPDVQTGRFFRLGGC
jgi:hypothetical protein